MNGINHPVTPVITGNPLVGSSAANTRPVDGKSFQDILTGRLESKSNETVTFSRHALNRTEQRGISITPTDMNRLDSAIGQARDKGLTDTLVFMNNTAFIVNVPSKVIVTVVDGADSANNVFTNIDGAVIV